jgi:hypothetical protein
VKRRLSLILICALLGGCASQRGIVPSQNGVTTGQGPRLETGLEVNIGPEPIESSPSVRDVYTTRPKIDDRFVDDPATIEPGFIR